MKRLEKIYAYGLLAIFAGIVAHAPLTIYIGTLFPEYALIVKAWKEILMLALVPVAVILVTQRKLWPEFARDWLFRLFVCYALLHLLIVMALWHGSAQAAAGLAIDLRYVLFFALVYTLVRIAPRYRKHLLIAAVAGAVIVLGFAVMQLFLPVDILAHIGYSAKTIQPFLTVDTNMDYIRVNSTLRGPNPLGAYAGVALAVLAAFLIMQKQRLDTNRKIALGGLALCGGIALWISYSRSALLAAVISVMLVVVIARSKQISKMTWGVAAGVVVAILGALFLLRDSSFVSNVILHDDPDIGGHITSNEGHAQSLADGFARMVQQPFGAGVGSTGSASLLGAEGTVIENQYLFIAHETGWLGLALYICIFVMIMYRLWGERQGWLPLGIFASGVGLAFIGLLQPVWADDTVSIIWWGLAALAIASSDAIDVKKGKSNGKKRTRK